MSASLISNDSSFWHQLEEQQSTSVVNLGHLTTNPRDPSISYWPGTFASERERCCTHNLERAWITHFTSLKFSSHSSSTATQDFSGQLKLADFQVGNDNDGESSSLARHDNRFLTDVLITYKLKNPLQYLRDRFDPRAALLYTSQFEKSTPVYMMTGYKVSRNAQNAIEQQEQEHAGLKFDLSRQLKLPRSLLKAAGTAIPFPASATVGIEDDHVVLKTIDYQAPGDTIFFVRYQQVKILGEWSGMIVVPTLPSTWRSWVMSGFKRPQTTVILARALVDGDQARARMLTSSQPVRQVIEGFLEADKIASELPRVLDVSPPDGHIGWRSADSPEHSTEITPLL